MMICMQTTRHASNDATLGQGPPIGGKGDLEAGLISAIRRIVHAMDLHSRQLVHACGLTGPQLAVLAAAGGNGGTTISRIAAEVRLTKGTVTGIVDRLERRGLVSRRRHERDRRNVDVVISQAGQEVLNRAPSPLQARLRVELASLPEWQRGMILASLQHVAHMMEAEVAVEEQEVCG